MTEARLAAALLELAADLEAVQAHWALVGGLAVSARAEPRTTRDIDTAIAVANDREAEGIVRALRGRGYLDEEVMEGLTTKRLATVRFWRRGDQSGVVCDLLFATAGIEPEVVAAADLLEILPGFIAPVAKVGHLLALKVLALDVDHPERRPQDFADIHELLKVADDDELRRARGALELISRRGFDRGKDLEVLFSEQMEKYRRGLEAD